MSTTQSPNKTSLARTPRQKHSRTTTKGKHLTSFDSNALSDDEEYPDDWVEFENESGEKIYLNRATNSVRLTDPKTHQKDLDQDGNEWGGRVDMVPFYTTDLHRAMVPTTKARRDSAVRKIARSIMNAEEPAVSNKAQKIELTDEQQAELTAQKIVDTIGEMHFNLCRIYDYGQNIQADSMNEILKLRDKLGFIHTQLEEGKQLMDGRNDVDALIDFKHLNWSWDNRDVDYYRATAQDRAHPHFDQWHFPQYFSDIPLPKDNGKIKSMMCQVFLPPSAATTTGALHFQVAIDAEHKVEYVINGALKKCRIKNADTEWVLKAKGFTQYMDPSRVLFSYEYIRLKSRDGAAKVHLSLVEKPKPLEDVEPYITTLKKSYVSKLENKPHVTPITEETHQNIPDLPWNKMNYVAMSKVNLPLKFRICGLENVGKDALPVLAEKQFTEIYLETFLFYGIQMIKSSRFTTREESISAHPRWMQYFPGTPGGETEISKLPRDARVAFILHGKNKGQNIKQQLAYYVLQLVDCTGKLTTGVQSFKMWPFPGEDNKHGKKKGGADKNFIYRATNRENLAMQETVTLRVDFAEYLVPIVAPLVEKWRKPNEARIGCEITDLTKQENKRLEEIKKFDALTKLKEGDYDLLWKLRHGLTEFPQMLPKFLQCVKWGLPDYRFEARSLLDKWVPQQTMVHVLELLDVKFPDYYVRKYAVRQMQSLDDDELQFYLLQITQCLKFQPYHDSPLSRFLIQRALRSPICVGHYFFWHLKAEMHTSPHFSERYAMILEEYLSHCGRHAGELRNQNNAVLKMQRVSGLIVRLKREEAYGDEIAMKEYTKELKKLNKTFFGPMGKFQIPLDPKWEATTLRVEKCRYMSSKMVPLWLVFNNADENGPPHLVMFKSGDDLRQDILTLQLLKVMDKLWLDEGLDMKLTPYRCIATGMNANHEGVGMIEIVLNSKTTSGIQLDYYGAVGAMKMDPIDRFLKENNKGDAWEIARRNFVASCAGYCVATFILGIGDRHNGNIMVTKDGHLFHIDFGHFLGNFKTKFGVNRERAAFVFTPEMAFVIGGRKYKNHPFFHDFLDYCKKAFHILRKNAAILEILFILMVSARMPELLMEDDILYLQEKLNLSVPASKAEKKLKSEINKSLDCTYRRFDNMIHNWKHG